jgi:hypothetical protein
LISRTSRIAPRRLLCLPLVIGLGGGALSCKHPEDHGDKAAPSASTSIEAPAPSEPAPAPTPVIAPHADAADPGSIEDPGPPVPAVEVRRTTLRRVAEDRALVPHEAALKEHFGNPISFPLAVQSGALPGGGRALLFQRDGKDHNPFILVHDAAGQALWTKDRPLAGIVPGVTEMVLVPTAKGDVLLSWYDPPTKIVAARHWDARGSILVDFPLLHADSCAALSGIHWPSRGFVVAAATAGAARVQLLTDAGTLAFAGEDGVALPWTSRADAPVSIAVDAGKGVTFFQVGQAGSAKPGAAPDHLLAARFDARGKALWPTPLVVGPVPGAVGSRVLLTTGNDGNVLVSSLGVTVTPGGSVIGAGARRPTLNDSDRALDARVRRLHEP